MLFFPVRAVTLKRHERNQCSNMRGIDVRVRRMPDEMLGLTYVIQGDLDRVRIPSPRTPCFADGLWQHTCCEIFIRHDDLPAYHEFNFSPSGEWAAYQFEGYRSNSTSLIDRVLDPRVTVRRAPEKLELDASLSFERFLPMRSRTTLFLALSAVIEDGDGTLSYWAIEHPVGEPDFHHPSAFALKLE